MVQILIVEDNEQKAQTSLFWGGVSPKTINASCFLSVGEQTHE